MIENKKVANIVLKNIAERCINETKLQNLNFGANINICEAPQRFQYISDSGGGGGSGWRGISFPGIIGGYGMYWDGFRSNGSARRAQHIETINISLLMSAVSTSFSASNTGKNATNLLGFLNNGANIGHDIMPEVGEIRILSVDTAYNVTFSGERINPAGLIYLKAKTRKNRQDSVYRDVEWF